MTTTTNAIESDTPEQAPHAKEQAIRYIAWILSIFAVNLTITCVLTYAVGLSPQISFLISLIIITTINFFGLRLFVYRAHDAPWRRQVIAYLITNGFQRSLEYGSFYLIYEYSNPPVYLTVPAVLAISTVMRFFIYRHLVFDVEQESSSVAVE